MTEQEIQEGGWVQTDPDNKQYGRQLGEKVFEFKELNHMNEILYPDEEKETYIQSYINLDHYTREKMFDMVNAYYDEKEFQAMLDAKEYWIIAECIFEQESGQY